MTLEPLGAVIGGDPATARRLWPTLTAAADDDKLAQLGRAAWNQGGAGPHPRRRGCGTRGRPLGGRCAGTSHPRRTIVEVGDGADAAFIGKLVPSAGVVDGGQALFTATTEIARSARPPGHGEPAGV